MSYAADSRAPGNHRETNDPSVPSETTGPIAKDSLAAESMNKGGDFAADDPSAQPLGVSGSKSTLNNTDTSGAVTLDPATSGSAREQQDLRGAGSDERGAAGLKYPDAVGGQPDFPGSTTSEGYSGGPAGSRSSAGYSTNQAAGASDFGADVSSGGPDPTKISSGSAITSSSTTASSGAGTTTSSAGTTGTGVRPFVDAAPNYAGTVSGAIAPAGAGQPHGTDLTEGGDVPPNKKTFTGDVGGPKDPGRVAEQDFEKINANTSGGGGVGRDKTGETEVGGQYNVLQSERA